MTVEFMGYKRNDNSFGTRNLVAVISMMDLSNPLVRKIKSLVNDIAAVCPPFGRSQVGEDFAQHIRALTGMGTNPNVAAVILVSIDRVSAEETAEIIARTGRRVEVVSITEGGTLQALERGVRFSRMLLKDSSTCVRQPAPLANLVLGVQCGGSDATSGIVANPVTGLVADRLIGCRGTVIMGEPFEWIGAEQILERRASSAELGRQLKMIVMNKIEYLESLGIDPLGSNPSLDNIAGGISTIEEKALGAIKKGGTTAINALTRLGEKPVCKGLVLMDGASGGVESTTSLVAGGSQVVIFTTGQGNPIGNPIAPVIKVSANSSTVKKMAENIDVDLSVVISDSQRANDAAETLWQELILVASGKKTAAEILDYTETSVTRIGLSL